MSWYSKQEDGLDKAEDDRDLVLATKVRLDDLEHFFIDLYREMSGIVPSGDKSTVERAYGILRVFLSGMDSCYTE